MFGLSEAAEAKVYGVLRQRYEKVHHLDGMETACLTDYNAMSVYLSRKKDTESTVYNRESYKMADVFHLMPKAFDTDKCETVWKVMEWFYTQLDVSIVWYSYSQVEEDLNEIISIVGADNSYFTKAGFSIIKMRYDAMLEESDILSKRFIYETLDAISFDEYIGCLSTSDIIHDEKRETLAEAYIDYARTFYDAGELKQLEIPMTLFCYRSSLMLALKACVYAAHENIQRVEYIDDIAGEDSAVLVLSWAMKAFNDVCTAKNIGSKLEQKISAINKGLIKCVEEFTDIEGELNLDSELYTQPFKSFSVDKKVCNRLGTIVFFVSDVIKYCSAFVKWCEGDVCF